MAFRTLAEIRRSCSEKEAYDRQFPLNHYVIRPLSFLLTRLILHLTGSPSLVAYVGLAVGLGGCALLLFPAQGLAWGAALLMLYAVLDAVDGNIARVTANVTSYGRLLDGVIGQTVESLYFIFLGLGMARAADPLGVQWYGGWALTAGWAAAVCKLLSAHIQQGYYRHAGSRAAAPGGKTAGISSYSRNPFYLLYLNLGAFNLQVLILFPCLALGLVDIFLLGYALFYGLQTVLFLVFYLNRARRNLI